MQQKRNTVLLSVPQSEETAK